MTVSGLVTVISLFKVNHHQASVRAICWHQFLSRCLLAAESISAFKIQVVPEKSSPLERGV